MPVADPPSHRPFELDDQGVEAGQAAVFVPGHGPQCSNATRLQSYRIALIRSEMINDLDWAWLAGLFEGEGSISFANVNSALLSLESTDHDVVIRVQAIAGGVVYGPYTNEHKLGSKPTWKWHLRRSNEVSDVLNRIRPYMSNRRTERIEATLSRLANCRPRPGRQYPLDHMAMVN